MKKSNQVYEMMEATRAISQHTQSRFIFSFHHSISIIHRFQFITHLNDFSFHICLLFECTSVRTSIQSIIDELKTREHQLIESITREERSRLEQLETLQQDVIMASSLLSSLISRSQRLKQTKQTQDSNQTQQTQHKQT